MLHRREKLVRHTLYERFICFERLRNIGDRHRPQKFGVISDKRLHRIIVRGLSNQVCNVEREKVAWIQKTLHSLQIDVVCVQKIGLVPPKFLHCSIRGRARLGWLRADDGVLAVRFVPHRDHLYPCLLRENACRKLGFRLVSKTVAYPD